jgi:N6-L-threonylcarbamoyladenine synthase
LHKTTILKGGYRKANQCPREVFGYRLNDVVRYKGNNWFVHGRRARGSFVLSNLDMTEKAEVSHRKIRLLNHTGTMLTERRTRNTSQP